MALLLAARRFGTLSSCRRRHNNNNNVNIIITSSIRSSKQLQRQKQQRFLHIIFGASSTPHPEKVESGGEDAYFAVDVITLRILLPRTLILGTERTSLLHNWAALLSPRRCYHRKQHNTRSFCSDTSASEPFFFPMASSRPDQLGKRLEPCLSWHFSRSGRARRSQRLKLSSMPAVT